MLSSRCSFSSLGLLHIHREHSGVSFLTQNLRQKKTRNLRLYVGMYVTIDMLNSQQKGLQFCSQAHFNDQKPHTKFQHEIIGFGIYSDLIQISPFCFQFPFLLPITPFSFHYPFLLPNVILRVLKGSRIDSAGFRRSPPGNSGWHSAEDRLVDATETDLFEMLR